MYDRFEEDDSSWSFALGLLVGAVVGAAVASLFTPRSGAQNREAVIERGLVLRDRVTEAGDSVTTRVRDTTTSVKDRAVEGVERVGAVAGATMATVQDAANTAAATVKDVAGTAAEKAQTLASTASERVQEAANTAAATVSEVAGTVNERARQITGRETVDEFELPAASEAIDELDAALDEQSAMLEQLRVDQPDVGISAETLAGEARYDAEDVRSAATDGGATEQEQLDTLASLDTFDGAISSTTALDDEFEAETVAGLDDESGAEIITALDGDSITESADPDGDLTSDMLPPTEVEARTGAGWSNLEAAVEEAQAEVASAEQFVVDEQAAAFDENTVAGEEDEDQRPA